LNRLRKRPGKIRIIGGRWRGTRLAVPDLTQLRPTPDRVRETVFNWLRNHIAGSVCLDLYAGTGALGFEAASRGAARVLMVEHNLRLVESMQQQADALKANMVEIVRADAIKWLAVTDLTFDLVFLDPPFGAGLVSRSLEMLNSRSMLRPGGLIYAEAESGLGMTMAGFQIVKQEQAGQVQYMLLEQVERE